MAENGDNLPGGYPILVAYDSSRRPWKEGESGNTRLARLRRGARIIKASRGSIMPPCRVNSKMTTTAIGEEVKNDISKDSFKHV
jgi:hypothetical protein